ncbi:MAG: hypothetical protein NVS4B3_17520 [Gemmatimonadaceae bacterium]
MGSEHPYYRRRARTPTLSSRELSALWSSGDHVDLSKARLPDFLSDAPLSGYPDSDLVPVARSLLDTRAAACVTAAVALNGTADRGTGPVRVWPAVNWKADDDSDDGPDGSTFWSRDLLEVKWYVSDRPAFYIPTRKCLSALAYVDFLPDRVRIGRGLRTMVSAALLAARPGWCGSFGPETDGTLDLLSPDEGNYDMTQMCLLHIAYQYHAALSPEASNHLVLRLLAEGQIHRPRRPDTRTSGHAPNDWDRAGFINPLSLGFVTHRNIGETENHILMIATVRYLTNQLLFQRDRGAKPDQAHDNRRNGSADEDDEFGAPCFEILLTLLRNYLRDDFSEYNAKPYQDETRWALLNLCTYAYDHEVRLAARMVLDYVSAHMAVSSNDLRRLVPFRRRNEAGNVTQSGGHSMTVALLEGWPNGSQIPIEDEEKDESVPTWVFGADPLGKYFALQAGNVRAFKHSPPPERMPPERNGTWEWGIPGNGDELTMEVLSDYRLPPSIHDLFVNDLHRRFYQRLHRTVRGGRDEMGGNHNCDNMEIYAGSPSYLITAGGSPAGYAIDPELYGSIVPGEQGQQLGVCVTTSFMPTSTDVEIHNDASGLIQFSVFSEDGDDDDPPRNYGVAPDFACGHNLYLPEWAAHGVIREGFSFINRSYPVGQQKEGPGFYLAIFRMGELAVLEAFDTWLRPDSVFKDPDPAKPTFCSEVKRLNAGLQLRENQDFVYTTQNGARVHAVIWSREGDPDRSAEFGAEVSKVEYGQSKTGEYRHASSWDAMGDAGNVTNRFLNGTILNSPREAVVEISNPALWTTLILDMHDLWHPKRTSESGHVEQAGENHEVWLDFDYPGPSEGDVCRPFGTVAAAERAVADEGTVRVVPGSTRDRPTIGAGKRYTLMAPIGGVIIGAAHFGDRIPTSGERVVAENVVADDVWVEFDLPNSNKTNAPVPPPVNTLAEAIRTVGDNRVIRIVPGTTRERSPIGGGRRFTLSAPIGGVTIGAR